MKQNLSFVIRLSPNCTIVIISTTYILMTACTLPGRHLSRLLLLIIALLFVQRPLELPAYCLTEESYPERRIASRVILLLYSIGCAADTTCGCALCTTRAGLGAYSGSTLALSRGGETSPVRTSSRSHPSSNSTREFSRHSFTRRCNVRNCTSGKRPVYRPAEDHRSTRPARLTVSPAVWMSSSRFASNLIYDLTTLLRYKRPVTLLVRQHLSQSYFFREGMRGLLLTVGGYQTHISTGPVFGGKVICISRSDAITLFSWQTTTSR